MYVSMFALYNLESRDLLWGSICTAQHAEDWWLSESNARDCREASDTGGKPVQNDSVLCNYQSCEVLIGLFVRIDLFLVHSLPSSLYWKKARFWVSYIFILQWLHITSPATVRRHHLRQSLALRLQDLSEGTVGHMVLQFHHVSPLKIRDESYLLALLGVFTQEVIWLCPRQPTQAMEAFTQRQIETRNARQHSQTAT